MPTRASKFGVGYALGDKDLEDKQRLRFLVGADLYNLISGSNVEVGPK